MRLVKYDLELDEKGLPALKECRVDEYDKLDVIRSAEQTAIVLKSVYRADKKAEEHVWLIAFDTINKPVGVFEVSHGTVNRTMTTLREIFMRLLLCGAVKFVIAHNHPAGDTTPSKEDIAFTQDIYKVSRVLNIEIRDSIIIGDDYFSFRENGFIEADKNV